MFFAISIYVFVIFLSRSVGRSLNKKATSFYFLAVKLKESVMKKFELWIADDQSLNDEVSNR